MILYNHDQKSISLKKKKKKIIKKYAKEAYHYLMKLTRKNIEVSFSFLIDFQYNIVFYKNKDTDIFFIRSHF